MKNLKLTIGLLFTSFCVLNAQGIWTQKADFGGAVRSSAVGFAVGTKGYIGTGLSQGPRGRPYNDFWEWDQTTNMWTQKANFGGGQRQSATGFSIGTKAYIGMGLDTFGRPQKDFWEWDQATNIWTKKADFGGIARGDAEGF